ncbi:MAG: DUF6465 family protein [Lachnospira sp.]|nr:DUF6465 family protein [Lachnospira sp.]
MVETKKENIVFGDAVKATEAKETVKKAAKTTEKKTTAKASTAKTSAKKTTAKAETKAAEVKETVKETAKAAPKKTTTAKKAVAPKKTVAKKETKTEVFIQYEGNQTDEEAVMKKVEADLKAQKVSAKEIKLYIKPEDKACYYVADGKVAGKVNLF